MNRWERFKKMNRWMGREFGARVFYTTPFFIGQAFGFAHTKDSALVYWFKALGWYSLLILSLYLLLAVVYVYDQRRTAN